MEDIEAEAKVALGLLRNFLEALQQCELSCLVGKREDEVVPVRKVAKYRQKKLLRPVLILLHNEEDVEAEAVLGVGGDILKEQL